MSRFLAQSAYHIPHIRLTTETTSPFFITNMHSRKFQQ